MKEIILDKLRDNTSLTIMELNDLLGLTTIDEYKSLQNTLDEMVSDGILYYSDKKTICEDETGINLDELAEEDKRELMYGKWIQDENELYSLLENYTS